MEQNLSLIAKRTWKLAKVVYFMLRKGISKEKLLSVLNVMVKRGKIAGKEAIQNLIFHHHAAAAAGRRDHEFSCGDSPATLHLGRHRHSGGHSPPLSEEDLMAAAAEMVNGAVPSPALPGFGPSPMVRRLRITDSPFPLTDVEEDSHVDEDAEEFILKFYRDLRQQNSTPSYYS